MGGHGKHASRSRLRALVAGSFAAALAVSVAACGGGSSSDANETAGRYPVEVTEASFPARQKLGSTSLMKLGVRNTGRKTIPALTVSVTIAGKQGETSTLPFAIHDPQPDLAQPDRPVWVLSEHYPKFAGSEEPGGAETSNQKTYDFGPLKVGKSADVVWKLSAVRAGRYTIAYAVEAGLDGSTRAVTTGGVAPGGSFTARISSAPLNKEVTDSGEVVEK
ncbi:MAG TPA: hypothetical protein VGH14_12695 [Solirubrobacterales bacterium]